jgi:hypothetical protein
MTAEGFQLTAEDEAEKERPIQSIAFLLVGRDRLIRWTLADAASSGTCQ